MDLESNLFVASSDTKSVVIYNKVVLWKKNATSAVDLPVVSLTDMQQFLFAYFNSNIIYDPTLNQTKIDTFFVGYGKQYNFFIFCKLCALIETILIFNEFFIHTLCTA